MSEFIEPTNPPRLLWMTLLGRDVIRHQARRSTPARKPTVDLVVKNGIFCVHQTRAFDGTIVVCNLPADRELPNGWLCAQHDAEVFPKKKRPVEVPNG